MPTRRTKRALSVFAPPPARRFRESLEDFNARWDLEQRRLDLEMQKIRLEAAQLVKDAMPSMGELAKESPAAFSALLKAAGMDKGRGNTIENNITIDRRNGGDNESAVQFIERFRERQARTLKMRESASD